MSKPALTVELSHNHWIEVYPGSIVLKNDNLEVSAEYTWEEVWKEFKP